MNVSAADLDLHVQATANRLRLIQVDCADDDPATRKSYLHEAIQQSLGQVVADQRRDFLERLAQAFPTWQAQAQPAAPPPQPTESIQDRQEWQDPAFLIERLTELAGQMDPQQKRNTAARLIEAGLAPASGGEGEALPPEAAAPLRAALKLGEDEPIDPARIAQMAAMLGEFAAVLDQVARSTWGRINTSARRIRPPQQPLREALAAFARGDAQMPRSGVEPSVDWLRKLLAAMVAGIGAIGFQWGNHFVNTLGPEAVKASATTGFMANREVCYWRRYLELTHQKDASTINHEITQMIEQFIVQVMG